MLSGVKRLALAAPLLALVIGVALPVRGSGQPDEQSVTAVAPSTEQRVTPVASAGDQHVEQLSGDGLQQITQGTKSPVRRAADGAAKVIVGVLAAGISIGATIASLLFL